MRTLYTKFIVITIGIMILSGVIGFLISNTYYQHKLKPYNDEKNTTIALNIANFIEKHPDINLHEYLQNISAIGYQLYLFSEDHTETYFGEPFRDNNLSSHAKQQVLNNEIYHGILNFPQETFVTGFFANELKNSIGVPIQHDGKKFALFIRPDIKLLFNEMHLLFGWLLILMISLSILLVLLSTKYLVTPLTKLTRATKELAQGNFHVQLDIQRHDEVGELSESFLKMASKLQQTEEMRKEFISNISHDIQSPLSNIKGYSNLLAVSNDTKEREQYLSIMNSEIKRLSSLTKQLLLLASLDHNDDLLKKKDFSLNQQMKELIHNNQWLISEKEIMLQYSFPNIHMKGDPELLYTVWDNLLSNAIKYNRPDGSIDISIKKEKQYVHVQFTDTGIGLRKDEQERIFERFYRADKARSKTIEGTGLGLSIASTIVHLHGGTIHLSSVEEQGTTFVVTLPE